MASREEALIVQILCSEMDYRPLISPSGACPGAGGGMSLEEKGASPSGSVLRPSSCPAPTERLGWSSVRGSWAPEPEASPEAPLLAVLGSPCSAPVGAQACSLSALQSRSFTSGGRVLNRSSSTTRPLRLSRGHSPSSTGRHSSRLPRSSIWVRLVSSPTREGSDCRTLLPRCRARSFRHWKSSGGSASIYREGAEGEVRRAHLGPGPLGFPALGTSTFSDAHFSYPRPQGPTQSGPKSG